MAVAARSRLAGSPRHLVPLLVDRTYPYRPLETAAAGAGIVQHRLGYKLQPALANWEAPVASKAFPAAKHIAVTKP